jgi:hypothetical protein
MATSSVCSDIDSVMSSDNDTYMSGAETEFKIYGKTCRPQSDSDDDYPAAKKKYQVIQFLIYDRNILVIKVAQIKAQSLIVKSTKLSVKQI